MNNGCPPVQPCYCPQADTPVSGTLLQQGGPAAVIQVPIYGTQGFGASITSNPTLPITEVPLISSVTIQNGNILTITTAVPDINETVGPYVATIHVCNACGELDIQVQIDVVADLNPVVTNCALAQLLWTPEARVPTAGDTLLAFTPAGCRALLPPVSACVEIAAFPAGPAPSGATRLVTNACNTVTVQQVIDLVDVCAEINAFPLVAPALTDHMLLIKAGVCGRATLDDIGQVVLDDVDLCQLFQDLPNAVVQSTATFFGEQGGNCFQFAVSDLAALVGVSYPLLAPDGSCAAPSYSFTNSPDSGMFYTGTAVRIGDDNCADFIEVGASINITSLGVVTTTGGSGITNNATGSFNVVATGNVNINGQNIGAFSNAALTLTGAGGPTQVGISALGHWSVATSSTQRLAIRINGEWQLAGNPGAAGEVITSNGAGLPPTWQAAGGGGTILPVSEIGFGTGAGITSDPDLTYVATNGRFRLNTSNGSTHVLAASPQTVTIFAAGRSGATGSGAAIVVRGGPSATDDGDFGGNVLIEGGAGNVIGGTGAAGTVTIQGGASSGNSSGGAVVITSTTGTGAGSHADITMNAARDLTESAARNIAFNAPAGSIVGLSSGQIILSSTAANVNVNAFTNLNLNAGGDFSAAMVGALLINGSAGVAGQVLTSQGPGLPPVWA